MLLIVSNSTTMNKVIENYLKSNFPNIIFDKVFNDIDAAKKLQENRNYKLILSDWDETYVDGHKLLLHVRKDKKTADTPFVVITDRQDKDSILSCINASVTLYIKKPIDNDIIDQKLKPLFEKIDKRDSADTKKQAFVSSVKIPPCPVVVNELYNELKKPSPSFTKIVENVKKDVSVASLLIKLANSPIYGSGKVDSIERALNVLGLKNFSNMIVAAALQNSIKDAGVVSEKFWKHSLASATLSAYIAKKRNPKHVDNSYLIGLFHDCAIPLFQKRFTDYDDIVDIAMSNSIEIIGQEEKRYNSNHADISSFVVKTWGIGDKYFEVIRYHHAREVGTPTKSEHYGEIRELWAILLLAEHISHYYGYSGTAPVQTDEDFVHTYSKVLLELQIDVLDIKDLKDDAYAILENISDSF